MSPPPMTIEKILAGHPDVNKVAALLCCIPDAEIYDYDPDRMVAQWNRVVESLQEECWANGKHCGDCTRVPMTCSRCVVESYTEQAFKFLEKTPPEAL